MKPFSRNTKKTALIATGLILAALVAFWLALPGILQSQAEKYIAEKSDYRLTLAPPQISLADLSLRLAQVRLVDPQGELLLGFGELLVDLSASSVTERALVFDAIQLDGLDGSLVLRKEGGTNWSALIAALQSPQPQAESKGLPRLTIRQLRVGGAKMAFADQRVTPAFVSRIEPLDLELTDVSTLPDDSGSFKLQAKTQAGAQLAWAGNVTLNPLASNGRLDIDNFDLERLSPLLKGRLPIAQLSGIAALGADYKMQQTGAALKLELVQMGLSISSLRLQQMAGDTAPRLGVDSLSLKDGSYDLASGRLALGTIELQGNRVEAALDKKPRAPVLKLDQIALTDVKVDLNQHAASVATLALKKAGLDAKRDAQGRVALLDLFNSLGSKSEATATEPESAKTKDPWRFNVGQATLDEIAVALRDESVTPAVGLRLDVGRFALKDGSFESASGQLALGAIELKDNRVEAALDKKGSASVLKLDQIAVSDVKLNLVQRAASITTLALNKGDFTTVRDAQGKLGLLGLIESLGTKPAAKTVATEPKMPGAPWRYKIGQVTLAEFAVALRDESVKPTVEFGLDNIAVGVKAVSENLTTPLPLQASLDVRSGGRLELNGTFTPAQAAADLKVKLSNLALKVAQPYIAQLVALDLADGKISAVGRVRHNAKGSDYRGNFKLRDLRLNEAGTKNVLLAWKLLATDTLQLGLRQLDVAQLQLDGLDTKLIIDKDKTTNLQRVLRKNQTTTSGSPAAATPATAVGTAPAKSEAPGFLVNIDRLRFANGALDFSDQSLILPFATHIHDLHGSIAGLSSKPGAAGKVELDGAVDEFGLARAVGQVEFFHPTNFMDLKVVFHNIEMTSMTPYSATFAGRKINSGKLSLDLEYKIKQRQLQGENKIVMERLELGERVESPTATDLPLDLAIALLSDSDGRIDLGLPISGSLDNPKFSFGQIVWKAIGNVLSNIVTAPFRALGALFGGGGEKLDKIGFEAGSSQLTPPEREKLLRLATVLNKRPRLALDIHGTWAELDRGALQDLQVRRLVAAKSGQVADENGDPGPLSTAAPKVQAALEEVFAERFGETELSVLKDGFRSANPGQLEESLAGRMLSGLSGMLKEKRSLDEAEIAQLKGADFHAVLFDKLRAKEEVRDAALQALAARRAEHSLEKLKAAGAPAVRIRLGAVEKSEAVGRDVMLKLEVGKAGS